MVHEKPIKKFKASNIEAAVWFNEKEIDGKKTGYKTVSLSRSWNKDGEWHTDSLNLRKQDLQKVILVLQKAQEDILLNTSSNEEEVD